MARQYRAGQAISEAVEQLRAACPGSDSVTLTDVRFIGCSPSSSEARATAAAHIDRVLRAACPGNKQLLVRVTGLHGSNTSAVLHCTTGTEALTEASASNH